MTNNFVNTLIEKILKQRVNNEINYDQFAMLLQDLNKYELKSNGLKVEAAPELPKTEVHEAKIAKLPYDKKCTFDFDKFNELLDKHKNNIALESATQFKKQGPEEEFIYNQFMQRFVRNSYKKYIAAFKKGEQFYPELKNKDTKYAHRPNGKPTYEDITFSRRDELVIFVKMCIENNVDPRNLIQIRESKIDGHAGLYETFRKENVDLPKGCWKVYVDPIYQQIKKETFVFSRKEELKAAIIMAREIGIDPTSAQDFKHCTLIPSANALYQAFMKEYPIELRKNRGGWKEFIEKFEEEEVVIF